MKKIFGVFLIWRIILFAIAFLAPFIITSFGGRYPYVETLIATGLPNWVWSFAGFDGVHYLGIAENVYAADYTQAFFPLYPILIKFVTVAHSYLLTSLIVSNTLFVFALYLIYRLYREDYDDKLSWRGLLLLLAFPTSFYFGAVYSESLLILLIAGCLLSLRKNNFILAGVLAMLASATRIFGILLTPFMALELYLSVKDKKIRVKSREFVNGLIGVLLAPLGAVFYMVYLKINFNDPLYFLNSQPVFGANRSIDHIILLPQVIFRYIKILATVPISTLPFWNAVLELVFTLSPLIVLFWLYKKIRLSYFLLTLGFLLLSSLTGTLTSMPRYALLAFLLLPLLAKNTRIFRVLMVVFAILQVILLTLFIRGYWVA